LPVRRPRTRTPSGVPLPRQQPPRHISHFLKIQSIAFSIAALLTDQSSDFKTPHAVSSNTFRNGAAVPPLVPRIVVKMPTNALRRHRPHQRVGASPVGLFEHHRRL